MITDEVWGRFERDVNLEQKATVRHGSSACPGQMRDADSAYE
jgi:hypothetical protein